MSVIKSVSVGHGDMFYIRHNSDNFTMIDCMLPTDKVWRAHILDELIQKSQDRGVTRFISTHPDQDHVQGLEYLDSRMRLLNFYCVKNSVIKDDPTPDFEHYCSLRDNDKAFYIYKGCSRRWMNKSSAERRTAGVNILWPDTANADYQEALKVAERGGSPNNTSVIIKYSLENGVTALWMGDLETDFMEKIYEQVRLPRVDILFAPHHGRASGRVPANWLRDMKPSVIVLGEAESEHMYYYPGWNTITQNQAGDITFDCLSGRVDVYVSSSAYEEGFLYDANVYETYGHYIGSFDV